MCCAAHLQAVAAANFGVLQGDLAKTFPIGSYLSPVSHLGTHHSVVLRTTLLSNDAHL